MLLQKRIMCISHGEEFLSQPPEAICSILANPNLTPGKYSPSVYYVNILVFYFKLNNPQYWYLSVGTCLTWRDPIMSLNC